MRRNVYGNNIGDNPVIFETVTLRPHWFQFVINEFMWIAVWAASFIIGLWAEFEYHEYLGYVWLLTTFYLVFKMLYLARIEYVVTTDQLIFLSGVVSHTTDYVELYRVIDYKQHQSAIQQIVGLKTVTIFSGDMNNPKAELIGIKESEDIVSGIRSRVEYNKQIKGVYEITNRI